jgi:hypothetical protein
LCRGAPFGAITDQWAETDNTKDIFGPGSLGCEPGNDVEGGGIRSLSTDGGLLLFTREMIRLRDVETDDLALFYEHQRNPVAVAMVAFQSRDRDEFNAHWAKLLADDSNLKKTVLVNGWTTADTRDQRDLQVTRRAPGELECLTHSSVQAALFVYS